MPEVSTIPAYVLANENLLFWMLKQPLNTPFLYNGRNLLREYAYVDFHRWNPTRPDHVFRHRWECFMHDYVQQKSSNRYGRKFVNMRMQQSVSCSIVLAALQCLADEYLEVRHRELHVKAEKFGWWQNMLSRISSLPIQALAYWRMKNERDIDPMESIKYNLLTLYPYDESVETYINQHGLNDSHIHVNLCAAAEECWLNALNYSEIEWAIQHEEFERNPSAVELYREIHIDLTPDVMYDHMQVAKRVRYLLICYAGDCETKEGAFSEGMIPYEGKMIPTRSRLATLCDKAPIEWTDEDVEATSGAPKSTHPTFAESPPNVVNEMRWMRKVINLLSIHPDENVERLFHLYLLLFNEFFSQCVQRDNFYGFKQFQKYSNIAKALVYRSDYYYRVFERMHGKGRNSVTNYAELRIAPKGDYDSTLLRLKDILAGYLEYVYQHKLGAGEKRREDALYHVNDAKKNQGGTLEEILRKLNQLEFENVRLVRPAIVFHFIKREWEHSKENGANRIRYREAREGYDNNLIVLHKLFLNYPKLSQWVRGIDAAADEMDAPPDIFAPAYRKARYQLNIPHVTYHAGEDFYHLISGIRVVYETTEMLEYRNGDRIGHATALGVDPVLWIRTMPSQVAPTRGEWLQDLIFAWHILQSGRSMQALVQKLNYDIREQGYAVFQKPHLSPYILKRVFDLRSISPREFLRIYKKAQQNLMNRCNVIPTMQQIAEEVKSFADDEESCDDERIRVYRAFCEETPEVLELVIDWNRNKMVWERSESRIEVPTEYFSPEELIAIQQLVMRYLVDRGVVIETLPTSNLRISQYKEMGQHHSLRWLGINTPEHDSHLPLVLGSDDPGVFATDIKAEFYHLFVSLCKRGLNSQEALNKLIQINECGQLYAFRPLSGNFTTFA